MVEASIGCQGNTPNPNSDGMRSSYEAEEVEEVKEKRQQVGEGGEQ